MSAPKTPTPRSRKKAPKTTKAVEGDLVTKETVTPNEVAIANDDEAQIMAQRIATMTEFKIDPSDLPVEDGALLTGKVLLDLGIKHIEKKAVSSLVRGITWMAIKRELGHGGFEAFIKQQNESPRSAREDIRVAIFLFSLSDSNRQRAADLPQRKRQLLLGLPVNVVENMFDEGELDNAAEMTRKDLREIVNLRKELEGQGKKMERMSETIAKQGALIDQHEAMSPAQLKLISLRKAAIEESEAIHCNIHNCQQVMEAVRLNGTTEYVDTIASILMWNIQGLRASIDALHQEAYSIITSYKPDMDVPPPPLTDDELMHSQRLAVEFAERAAMRAATRDMDAAAEVTRQRGAKQ